MLALMTLLASSAMAGDMRVHLEGGTLPSSDPLDDFSVNGSNLRHGGLRLGYGLGDSLEAVASFSAGTSRNHVDYVQHPDDGLAVRLNTWTYGLGARYRLGNGNLHPYGLAQARLFQAGMRMDGDPNEDENLDAFVHRAFAPGAYGALGIELEALPEEKLSPTLFLEGGYSWFLDPDFGEAGRVTDMRGFGVRAGVGLAF